MHRGGKVYPMLELLPKSFSFNTYFSPFDLLTDLKFKKIGTKFSLLYLPENFKNKEVKNICYIMSGYFPNLENINALSHLISKNSGNIDICFRYGSYSDQKNNIDKLKNILPHTDIRLRFNHEVDPLSNRYLSDEYDWISLPYTTHGMFEMDDIRLDSIKNLISNTRSPVMIF